MPATGDIKLENVDGEDIGDVLTRLEKSFGIKYRKAAFEQAKTFGDICNVIESHINLEHQDACTTQQAFYKLRKAISLTLEIDERDIKLDTKLDDLFPREKRPQNIEKLQQQLALTIDILRMKQWLVWILFTGLMSSLFAFFFDWRIAVSGFAFFYWSAKIISWFAKELEVQTVGQLTKKIARDNYFAVRRRNGTVNKNELFGIIRDAFSADLYPDKSLLTKDASLGRN